MTEIVAPKPQFRSVTEAAALAALNNPDPANPIAIEIVRLTTADIEIFLRQVERRLEHISGDILPEPRWPIEAVAMSLAAESIRDSVVHLKSLDATN